MSAIKTPEHTYEDSPIKYKSRNNELYFIVEIDSQSSKVTDSEFKDNGSSSSICFDLEFNEFSQQMALAKKIMQRNWTVLKRLAE